MADTMSEILNPSAAQKDPEFPHAPEGWGRESALAAAQEEGLELSPDHWEAVSALQTYFAEHERPNPRQLTDALDERFHARGGLKFLYGLFPGGPIAQGCRLSGLEPPPGSVNKSFGSVR